MNTANYTIYGMTPEQVLEIRDFWLRHHKDLPKPEPTFKEVTMYAPVYKNNVGTSLYQSREQAFSRLGAIGYAEVKVYLKESEDDDE